MVDVTGSEDTLKQAQAEIERFVLELDIYTKKCEELCKNHQKRIAIEVFAFILFVIAFLSPFLYAIWKTTDI